MSQGHGSQYISDALAKGAAINPQYVGGLGNQLKTEPAPSFVQTVEQRLESMHALVRGNVTRLQDILDRAYGAVPESAQSGGARPMPTGVVASINTRMEDMADTLELQRSLIARLESLA